MNANELADELTKMFKGEEYDRLIHEIPDMLRGQADLIEVLRNQPNIDYDKELLKPTFVGRELTDDEIIELFEHPDDFNCIDFARAILRKAQEK
jgi:hypothetical protein